MRADEHVPGADHALRGAHLARLAVVDLERPRLLVDPRAARGEAADERQEVPQRVELRLALEAQRLARRKRQRRGVEERHMEPERARRLVLLLDLPPRALGIEVTGKVAEAAIELLLVAGARDQLDRLAVRLRRQPRALVAEGPAQLEVPGIQRLGEMRGGEPGDPVRDPALVEERDALAGALQE